MTTRSGTFVVTVLLLASALAVLSSSLTAREAEAQTFSRSVCTPATVYVPVYVTVFQTLSHTAWSTSYSLTYSAYTTSYPVTYYSATTSSLTQLINWTISVTQMGVFGTFPSSAFGAYSDLAVLLIGVLGGAAVGVVVARGLTSRSPQPGLPSESPKVIGGVNRGLTWLNPQPEPPAPLDEGILFCRKCGVQLAVGQKFCRGCGTALSEPGTH